MATLNRIRSKSGVLIAIIGFALFAFVLGDLFKSGSSLLRGDQFVVGVIDGTEVSYQDFNPEVQRTLEAYKSQGLTSLTQVSNIVWNNIERKTLVDNEVEKLGLNIGEDELWYMIITDPSIQNAPAFQSEQGIFMESKVKDYLKYIRDNANSNAQAAQQWYEWINFERSLKERGIVTSYYNLINSGINATDLDGKKDYQFRNDQVDAKYVYLPYSSVNDTEVKVEDKEIADYISDNSEDFKVEAGRDIQYVMFKVSPSLSDEAKVKDELLSVLEDKVEYNNTTGVYDTISGFRTTKQDSLFVNSNSDVRFDGNYYHKGTLPTEVENFAFSAKTGDVYGPFNDNGTLKLTKLVSVKTLPDSVKASHILISHMAAQNANPSALRTADQAKKLADSISNVLNRNPKKFADLATELSEGPTASKGGDLGWFTYGAMVPEFNNFVFSNKKGKIGVVETVFGFHVIKIEDQKNISKAVKLATIQRAIVPSEDTDNAAYTKASNFSVENKTLEAFQAGAAANGYEARNVEGLGNMEFNIPGLGDQREIVKWAFNEETTVGSTKLQAVEDGYVVVLLYGTSEEGLRSVEYARAEVEPIIRNEKKAEILSAKLKGDDLEAIATAAETTVKTANSIHFENPIIPGAGREPKVVGELFGLEKGATSEVIVGSTGVFVVKVENTKAATELPNYATYSNQLTNRYKTRVSTEVFNALKNSVQVTDNRARFY